MSAREKAESRENQSTWMNSAVSAIAIMTFVFTAFTGVQSYVRRVLTKPVAWIDVEEKIEWGPAESTGSSPANPPAAPAPNDPSAAQNAPAAMPANGPAVPAKPWYLRKYVVLNPGPGSVDPPRLDLFFSKEYDRQSRRWKDDSIRIVEGQNVDLDYDPDSNETEVKVLGSEKEFPAGHQLEVSVIARSPDSLPVRHHFNTGTIATSRPAERERSSWLYESLQKIALLVLTLLVSVAAFLQRRWSQSALSLAWEANAATGEELEELKSEFETRVNHAVNERVRTIQAQADVANAEILQKTDPAALEVEIQRVIELLEKIRRTSQRPPEGGTAHSS